MVFNLYLDYSCLIKKVQVPLRLNYKVSPFHQNSEFSQRTRVITATSLLPYRLRVPFLVIPLLPWVWNLRGKEFKGETKQNAEQLFIIMASIQPKPPIENK